MASVSSVSGFVSKYAQSLVALIIALVVIFFVLNFLHMKFGGNVVGTYAGDVGALASGQKYTFQ